MIGAESGDGARFAARLAAKAGRLAAARAEARRLGEARAEARVRRLRGDPRRWRLARLLWPLFGKER